MRIDLLCTFWGISAILWTYDKSDMDYKDDITANSEDSLLLALPIGDDDVGDPLLACYTRLCARW